MNRLGVKITLVLIVTGVISVLIALMIAYFQNSSVETKQQEMRKNVLKNMMQEKLWKKEDVGLTNAVAFSANGVLKEALVSNNRELAIKELASIGSQYKTNTNFKGVKIHLHTKDIKSFVRSWKLNNYGDDLSVFRSSIKKIKSEKKADVVYELGKSGMFIRGIVPIIDSNEYLGSLEFMQGVGSVNRDFLKQKKHYIMLLNEEAVKVAKGIVNNKKFGNLYVSNMKWFSKDTLDVISKLNLKELFDKGHIFTDDYFATYSKVVDVNGKTVGYHIIAESSELILSNINRIKNFSLIYISLIIFLVLSIVVFISIVIKKMVTKRLEKFSSGLENFFEYLNGNSNNIKKIEVGSNDEFTQMAAIVNKNIENTHKVLEEDKALISEAKDVIERVKHGWYSDLIKGNSSNKALNEFKDNVNEMINETKNHFVRMNSILNEYTNHDYRKKLQLDDIESGGVFQTLIDAINELRDSITDILVENKRNGVMLNDSARTLLTNVSDLSKSSNDAAVSLEETAAALEEVTSNISSNSQNVMRMTQYSNELSNTSKEGAKLANQTTTSMDEINEQVASINEAITVIDQIAFQTNILSLNAAVEAATAGEAGKGFAVVAQEVRNLASRSAEAAQEIKKLVESATLKAHSGKNVADKMIEGYGVLNENILNTITVIKEVDTASKEQEKGITQINNAVNLLDRQTQTNASVATQTQTIANTTSAIASKIVDNANKKEFDGKDSTERRKKAINESYDGKERRDIERRIKQM